MKHIINYICIFLLFTNTIYAQSNKGYIDFDSTHAYIPEHIKEKHPEYHKLKEELKSKTQQFEDSLSMLQDQYKSIIDDVSSCYTDFTEKGRNEITNKIANQEEKIEKFYKYASLKIKEHEQVLIRFVLKITLQELKPFCEERNIDFVADKKSLYYCPDCMGYTDEFIGYLKQNDKR